MKDVSLSEVLAENYLTVGATGKAAISYMWDDVAESRFDQDWLDDMGITYAELIAELLSMTTDIIANGKLDTVHGFEGLAN